MELLSKNEFGRVLKVSRMIPYPATHSHCRSGLGLRDMTSSFVDPSSILLFPWEESDWPAWLVATRGNRAASRLPPPASLALTSTVLLIQLFRFQFDQQLYDFQDGTQSNESSNPKKKANIDGLTTRRQ